MSKEMPKNNKDSSSITANNFGSPNKPAFENAALGFVYKSLINRDPNKRKIKPVESILSMDADLDDSESDDSDYNPPNLEIDDVEIESDADEIHGDDKSTTTSTNANSIKNKIKTKKKKLSSNENDDHVDHEENESDDSSGSDSDSDSDSGSDSEDEEDEENYIYNNTNNNHNFVDKSSSSIINNSINDQLLNLNQSPNSNISSSHQYNKSTTSVKALSDAELAKSYKKILICAVCLGEISHSEDEIVECDACGISVHELCYGITADDTESIHSNASSASTEPWFCDPCKAGIKNPLCELCPNQGGIYKITDNGRWVHMVCALYTHGITFADTEKLRGPILSDINYGRWGSKICMLCEDDRYSQTGVCICCDAGMCKTYFHVTCAQREGLLTELRHSEEVDPFIAYCRLHSDRHTAKKKRRNYYALVARYRFLMKNQSNTLRIEDSINNQRTLNKLYMQREKFQKNFQMIENADIPSKRTPRLLDASPSAMRRLTNRCELAGFNLSRSSHLLYEELSDIRRKWYIQPAFSVEFISYYIDRNERIAQMQSQSHELLKQNKHLKDVESNVFSKYNLLLKKNEQIKTMNDTMRSKILQYLSVLSSFQVELPPPTTSNESLLNNIDEINRIKTLKIGQRILNLPEMLTNDQQYSADGETTIGGSGGKSASGSSSKSSKLARLREFHLKECATCKKSNEQHMMALCDSCHLYYHLHCLDPPLRRMPKKTRFGGWQCSNCTENEDNQQMNDLVTLDDNHEMNKSNAHNGSMSSTNDDSTVNSDIGGQTTLTSSNRIRRRLRENPKVVSKYTDHDDLSNQGTNYYCGKPKNRQNPNGSGTCFSSTFNSTHNNSNIQINRRGRKPKMTSPPVTISSTSNKNSSVSHSSTTTTSSPINSSTPISSSVIPISRKRKLSNSSSETFNNSSDQISTTSYITENGGDSNLTLPSANSNKTPPIPFKRSVQCSECFVCKTEVQTKKQTVRCDNCGNDYHFGCLKPPCTKSPKRRGYTWCCFVCEKNDQKRFDSHSNVSTAITNTLSSSSSSSNIHSQTSTTIEGIEDDQQQKEQQPEEHQESNEIKTSNDKNNRNDNTTPQTVEPLKSTNLVQSEEKDEKTSLSPSTKENDCFLPPKDINNIDSGESHEEIVKTDDFGERPEETLNNKIKHEQETTIDDLGKQVNNDGDDLVKSKSQSLEVCNLNPENTATDTPAVVVSNSEPVSVSNPTEQQNQNNNSNNEINMSQIANTVDDINTVLNDIIMLEEEAQNQKKKQESTVTVTNINNKHDLEDLQMIQDTQQQEQHSSSSATEMSTVSAQVSDI